VAAGACGAGGGVEPGAWVELNAPLCVARVSASGAAHAMQRPAARRRVRGATRLPAGITFERHEAVRECGRQGSAQLARVHLAHAARRVDDPPALHAALRYNSNLLSRPFISL
jgi:hypothetical protein